MKCTNCGKELKSGWKICPYCKTEIKTAHVCPKCGEEVEPDWEACPFCGAELKVKAPQSQGFEFSDDTAAFSAAFDKQLAEEESLKRAAIMCVREDFASAEKIINGYLKDHFDDPAGYVYLLRVHSKNFSEFEGDEIEKDLRTIDLLCGGQSDIPEYNGYIASRKKHFEGLAAAKKKAEENKRKAEEARLAKEKAEKEAAEKKRKAEEAAQKKAEEDAEYQYSMGDKYYYGHGGAGPNYAEAVKWYKKAAAQGHSGAQLMLGECYDFGQGITQSSTEAVKWYKKAAAQGHSGAQCMLGSCYAVGSGVTQSNTEALKWYKKSAEQGDEDALFNLALCYYHGDIVTKNLTEAKNYLKKAAKQGHPVAQSFCKDYNISY